MSRRTIAKAMRIGRMAVFGVGLAVTLVIALGAAMTALAAAPGDPLRLGQANVIDALTNLVGNRGGPLLRIKNDGGPALNLTVPAGQPPAVVSAGAAKVVNLDADRLDGRDASAFLPTKIYVRETPRSGQANRVSVGSAECDPGDVALSGGFNNVAASTTLIANGRGSATSWTVHWQNGAIADEVGVQVVCADLPQDAPGGSVEPVSTRHR